MASSEASIFIDSHAHCGPAFASGHNAVISRARDGRDHDRLTASRFPWLPKPRFAPP
jgi:hypothetical protein